MGTKEAALLDAIDCSILAELQANARLAYAELGRRVKLSTPAVIERVRRLEESGVITGYRTCVNPARVGLAVHAFVKVTVAGDKLARFTSLVRTLPEVLECHRVTGAESFLVQVAVRDTIHLEAVIDAMMPYVATNTSMILSSPVPWNSVLPASRYDIRMAGRRAASGKKPRSPLRETAKS
jgi:Lrp/AsnC family leucine-responsive transcriptional regulator